MSAAGTPSTGNAVAAPASYLLERALVALPGRPVEVRDQVRVTVADGRFTSVEPDSPGDPSAVLLAGLTLPGLANTHSHAFHRALRGRTQRERGSFWTWREQMYGVARRLDPASYGALARATYREMLAAGVTSVGEFHYVHHRPDGTPYGASGAAGGAAGERENALALALVDAARDVGMRITLLDTCYLAAGFGRAPEGAQVRFSDGTAEAWARRTTALRAAAEREGVVVGTAVHSVRAVPPDALGVVAATGAGRPLHVHLSEQVAENEACLAATGLTPTALLDRHGVLGPMTSLVHATHLTDDDVARIGGAAAYASFCPTTERDLGDGIGPSRALAEAGSRLTLGSDSHAVIDPFEEMRAVELDERLRTQQRGHWSAGELLAAATYDGHTSLGFADAGRIAVGARADLVTLDTSSPATAGTGADEQTAVFAATAADVVHVVVDGRVVHTSADRAAIGAELGAAVARLHDEPPEGTTDDGEATP